jgi:hypothetical protein
MSDKSGSRKRSAAKLFESEEADNASLREQLQQLAASNQQLAASNQQKEQQLQQKDQQIQHFKKNSIYALLTRAKSGNETENLCTFVCQGNDKSHTTSNSHLPASATRKDFILEEPELTEEMAGRNSLLMTQLDNDKSVVSYQSEADISMYIKLALGDAITMVSLMQKIQLRSRHEQSIFSQRPDHVVVYDFESNLPIIAVEGKKPAPGGIWTKNTAGQVFDYAVSMHAFGHQAPFVVLSSVEQTFVTWLDESLSRTLAEGSERIKAVSTKESSPSMEMAANALNQADETPSPPHLINIDSCPQAQIVLQSQALSGSPQLMFEAKRERTFCRSNSEYKSSQLALVLYSAILCGLQGLDRSNAKSITRFTPPVAGETKRCLELSENSYSWGTISSNEKRSTRCTETLKKYYVVGVIGSGNTSKVFHAVDLDCKEYAIKMYVQRFAGKTRLTKEAFDIKGLQSVTTEVENFKLIYHKLDVVHEKLNTHHCVIMPYFNPVPKDKREGYIAKIETVLKMFALKNRKYKDDDIRWRHVGLHEGKCILYDLAELEASTSNSFVSQHVEELKRRANTSSHSTGQAFSSIGK